MALDFDFFICAMLGHLRFLTEADFTRPWSSGGLILPCCRMLMQNGWLGCNRSADSLWRSTLELVTRSCVGLVEASPADEAAGEGEEGVVEF
ncbi:hypothetical protein ACFV0H_41190, partial [Streptomyces erythrochromogenes]|uniref:hypothetical protein n=1 Tax=Streptomyces erythrochromogenes TaxID=285574 RepID=UPI0036A2A2B9